MGDTAEGLNDTYMISLKAYICQTLSKSHTQALSRCIFSGFMRRQPVVPAGILPIHLHYQVDA